MRIDKYLIVIILLIMSPCLPALVMSADAASQSTGTSKATITFEEDTDIPDILDPDNPDEPYIPDPDDDGATGHAGPLSLDYVSSIAFGNHKLSLKEEEYQSTTITPFIQVTDKRGNATGWQVEVKATPFFDDRTTTALKGAMLHFTGGECLSSTDNQYIAPIPETFDLATDGLTASKVVSASENEGRGSWVTKWCAKGEPLNHKVTLTIPGGVAKEGVYKSTLTWTLSDAP
ncbi:MAG TPA: WxL domain-containing protein [Cerasibacillus sp.]|uniref:WxL domain-containing protein n=1 Tax=Cerasibacillus sp. TaxID=2498711 RepID=UPI002F3E828F